MESDQVIKGKSDGGAEDRGPGEDSAKDLLSETARKISLQLKSQAVSILSDEKIVSPGSWKLLPRL